MKMQLTVTVTYTTNLVPESVLQRILELAAEHLSDNGLLTRNTDAEVAECVHEVRRVES